MTAQDYDTPLFHLTTQALARRTDPQESHDAARSVRNLPAVKRAILNQLRTPRTDEELFLRMRFIGSQVSPSGCRSRRAELVAAGLVVRVGTGKTSGGRACAVWAVK